MASNHIDTSKALLIDHHCHVLQSRFLSADSFQLKQAFSESRSHAQIEQHVPNTLCYRDMISRLGRLLDVKGEEQIFKLRESMDEEDYARLLFDDASIGTLIVDDGLTGAGLTDLREFSEVTGRKLFRCKRLENFIESLILDSDTFEQMDREFPLRFFDGPRQSLAFKTIAGYRGGLEIDLVTRGQAEADFERARELLQNSPQPRIRKRPIYHYFLLQAFHIAGDLRHPIQIHCGIGDQDEDIRLTNPACMRRVLQSPLWADTNFVFLHCYPYIREAAYLCSIYPNVYMDISLATFLAAPAMPGCFVEALSAAPFTKILVSTDGHDHPETHWYSATIIRKALGEALNQLIDDGYMDVETAEEVVARVLHQNASELYSLPPIV